MLGRFQIHQPTTVAEASRLLATHGDEASVYAGGTELLLLMKERLVHYPHLVDIKTIPGLDGVELSLDGSELRVGALVTHFELECSALVKERAPLLAQVEAQIANVRVRTAGTVGGNLCFAEPHSDLAPLLLAWGAMLELAGADGRREVPIDNFFVGLLQTVRRHDELLTEIRLPLLPRGTGGAYKKFKLHERPSAGVAALLRLRDGVVADARLAIGSVGAVPTRVVEGEVVLHGERPSAALFGAAAEQAARAADPVDDLYGSADYKRHLVQVLTVRALEAAAADADGKTDAN
ncbi:MAG TPA: hypothetical protein DEP84_29175 [Chloroflexi bacterium]|nr:hypothetical protein [Chloroflexota bacterium]